MPIHVSLTYRDDKTEDFVSTESPYVGGDWVTIFNGQDRICVPASCISRVEYTLSNSLKVSTRKSSPKKR